MFCVRLLKLLLLDFCFTSRGRQTCCFTRIQYKKYVYFSARLEKRKANERTNDRRGKAKASTTARPRNTHTHTHAPTPPTAMRSVIRTTEGREDCHSLYSYSQTCKHTHILAHIVNAIIESTRERENTKISHDEHRTTTIFNIQVQANLSNI